MKTATSTVVSPATERPINGRARLNLAVVGHVDHGKSTVVGRLMADTGSLPQGKLEQLREYCRRNAKPFEYAFLLDALKNEQSQGITIDTARCFFRTARRDYILHDTPGHVEFLKNMITGASRAEAVLLVIDANEGIQENSKRHGYMVSMLGIGQVTVLVNKMDLVDYRREVFDAIREEYVRFLRRLGVEPRSFIPLSAMEGANLTARSGRTPWFTGPTVLEQIESFQKPPSRVELPLRLPVQDIYKFTEGGDDRRIIAGTIETGRLAVGDEVVFYPSRKRATVQAIERFNAPEADSIDAGRAAGVTLNTQIYIKPGELMSRARDPQPRVGFRFRTNLFWMGRFPMVPHKSYKLKLAAARVQVNLVKILSVLDASELSSVEGKQQVDRHDVAECILETARPIAFDLRNELEETGRFAIVDNYEIAGCGIVLEQLDARESLQAEKVRRREFAWEKGLVSSLDRETRFHHRGKFVVVTGLPGHGQHEIAKALERELFARKCNTSYLGIGNLFDDLDAEERLRPVSHDEHVQQLGELARIMTDAGLLFITTLTGVDDYDLDALKVLNEPNELFVVNVGENVFSQFPVGVQLPRGVAVGQAVETIIRELNTQEVLLDYVI
jgi:bifunctional enzyme CysN/CysC